MSFTGYTTCYYINNLHKKKQIARTRKGVLARMLFTKEHNSKLYEGL